MASVANIHVQNEPMTMWRGTMTKWIRTKALNIETMESRPDQFLKVLVFIFVDMVDVGSFEKNFHCYYSCSLSSASNNSLLHGTPNARLMRAMVSMVGIRPLVSTNRIIGRESNVNSASSFNDNPLASRRCRITSANVSHTGSSAVRGNGLFAENGTVFQNLISVPFIIVSCGRVVIGTRHVEI